MVNMVVTVTVRVCTVMRRQHVRTVTSCPLSTVKNYSYRPAHLLSNHLDEVTLTEHWSSMRPQTQTQSLAILRLDIADRAVLRVAGDGVERDHLISLTWVITMYNRCRFD